MLFPIMLLLAGGPNAASQEGGVPKAEDSTEVVVVANVRLPVTVWDVGSDRRLYNCRVLRPSGLARRDVAACIGSPTCPVAPGARWRCPQTDDLLRTGGDLDVAALAREVVSTSAPAKPGLELSASRASERGR